MATNEATLKKLSTALQNLIKNSKKGGKFVKGGMYGVEQVAQILEALDVYVRTYLDLNYQDINKVINSTEELDSILTIIGGIPFDSDLVLKASDNNKKYIYVGNSTGVIVYPPDVVELLTTDVESWQVTLENGSNNGSDINIVAQDGSTIDTLASIPFGFGFFYQISWDGDDNYTSTLGGGAASGEANTSSNDGAGEGLAKTKAGTNLPFKSIKPKSANVLITSTADEVEVDVDVAEILSTDWMALVRGWDIEPTLNATITGGEVWDYHYDNGGAGVTYYRYIATDGSIDAFYTTFINPTLSGLIVEKKIIL